MPNYVIEGGINFYEELKQQPITSDDNETNNTDIKSCLLTKMPLVYGHITLPCTHTFNFLPLYNEVLSQKINPDILKNVYHIRMGKNHIKCPYCRTIHSDTLLPYIVGADTKRIVGVNAPVASCMPTPFKCQHTVSKTTGRGKNKHTSIVECTATKNIYFCANRGGNNSEDAKFFCKKHCHLETHL